jgi:exodeoxyribonuclease V beta subunit
MEFYSMLASAGFPHFRRTGLFLGAVLTVGALARCFEDHADPAHRPYAASLAALSDEKFQGLLQGYIDRLTRQGPAWGVIDWKTNRLGSNLSDYDEAALLRCAMQDHYLLQTHLYLVALRRYLRALGLVDHPLAGAWLVFLRAIAPGETRGVLHINPPAAMLDALDRLFAPALRPLV